MTVLKPPMGNHFGHLEQIQPDTLRFVIEDIQLYPEYRVRFIVLIEGAPLTKMETTFPVNTPEAVIESVREAMQKDKERLDLMVSLVGVHSG